MQTWCGQRTQDLETVVPEHFIACAPETVTCEKCCSAMRRALENLQEWVPKLPNGTPTEIDQGQGEGHSYFCLYCKKTVSELEADKGTFPARHKHCGGELAAILAATDDSEERKNNNDS